MEAPSTENYQLGSGVISFDKFDSDGLPTGMRDLGNAVLMTIEVAVEKKDHFTRRTALRSRDKTVVLSASAMVKFTLDEYDRNNVALALFGTLSGNVISIMKETEILGQIRFVGDPTAGPRWSVDLWRVNLKPTKPVDFLSEDWGTLEFEGTIEDDTDNHPSTPYGTVQEIWDS